MTINFASDFITTFGFPIFVVGCLIYILHYIYKWVTNEVKPKLIEALESLNVLGEYLKTLDNDVENINKKISIVKSIDNRKNKCS